ncbi:DUF4097 family beta strand repeat-containing protein [Streptacidiphilus rugosus]|uniref:DUF4097 family beta strand repeat-containing protein n=1 Tax=Streptacidiphilus rugosus TaxID=405783 RepID=UPI0005653472|nr:DUF4097 family beta strand repeat-containing protein [Streptacidiphilus rugosus]
MQKFPATAPVTAVLGIPSGRVHLIAADRTDITVEVRPADPSRSRDVKAAEQVSVAHTDGVLRISTAEPKNQLFGPSGSVQVTVQLPAGSHVQTKADACELRVVGRLGDLVFEGAYQHIKVDEAASLRLTAVDGNVEIGRITGPAQITTHRGDITVAEAHRGTVDLRTQDGHVTVAAAPGVSASLNAGTGHGRVSNALKNDGATGLTIRATTHRGDITAHSL